MMKFKMRKFNLEFRWSSDNKKYELIKWFKSEGKEESCIVIAFYNYTVEGYEVKFVGKRPFEVENQNLFWQMLKYGQTVCDAEFELENNL